MKNIDKERPIGEVFSFEGVTLDVVEDKTKSCEGCFFDENYDEDYNCDVLSTARELGFCVGCDREDRTSVIFKLVK